MSAIVRKIRIGDRERVLRFDSYTNSLCERRWMERGSSLDESSIYRVAEAIYCACASELHYKHKRVEFQIEDVLKWIIEEMEERGSQRFKEIGDEVLSAIHGQLIGGSVVNN